MSAAYRFLVNPRSGSGSAPALVEQVARTLTAAGAAVVVETSRGPDHCRASAVAAVAAGEVVVAAGGDGMLASVAGTVAAAGGVLGIVPGGRGNDFARMLGMPTGPDDVARWLLEGRPEAVDVIDSDGAVVLGSVYAGVDSLASALVDASRRLPTAVQYPYATVRALLSYRPRRLTVTVDGVTSTHHAYTVVVANSAYYGRGMRIAPTADVRDGLLDVVVLPARSRLAMVRSLPRVYDGTHVDLPDVVVRRGRAVTVAEADGASSGDPVVAYGDGERLGPLPRTATVRPGALRVLLRGQRCT